MQRAIPIIEANMSTKQEAARQIADIMNRNGLSSHELMMLISEKSESENVSANSKKDELFDPFFDAW